MRAPLALATSLVLLAPLAACGGGDSGSGGQGSTSTSTCGTESAPEVLTLADVQPAAGSSVPNDGIVHAFTIKGATGMLQSLSFSMPGGKHTAGNSDPAAWSFQVTPSGSDHRYEAAPMKWQIAPGDVLVQVAQVFKDSSGCVFAFPDPLFSYSVTPAGAGDAGTGGGDAGTGGGDGGV